MNFYSTVAALLLGFFLAVSAMAEASPESTLDALHQAGAAGDQAGFVALLAPDAVFIGVVDGDARLQGAALRDFISAGSDWDYRATEREVRVSGDGTVAWFDEVLRREPLAGGRGSGVLVSSDGVWKIAQYHLSAPQADVAATAVAPAPAAPAATQAQQKPECRKIRHKTNKQASC